MVQGLGFRLQGYIYGSGLGLGFGVLSLGFRVWGLWFGLRKSLGFRIYASGFGLTGLAIRADGMERRL